MAKNSKGRLPPSSCGDGKKKNRYLGESRDRSIRERGWHVLAVALTLSPSIEMGKERLGKKTSDVEMPSWGVENSLVARQKRGQNRAL